MRMGRGSEPPGRLFHVVWRLPADAEAALRRRRAGSSPMDSRPRHARFRLLSMLHAPLSRLEDPRGRQLRRDGQQPQIDQRLGKNAKPSSRLRASHDGRCPVPGRSGARRVRG